jgi:hypothetical protein
MKEEPYTKILDREGPQANIEQHFKESIELVQEVVNYGTMLIPRALQDSKRDLTAAVLLGGFLKQAVTMVDAVEILVSQGALLAAQVPARSLLEAYFYILWILDSDTEKRIRQYHIWTLRQTRMWANRLIPGTDENKAFQSNLQQIPQIPSQILEEAHRQVKEIDRVLGSDENKSINEEFNNLKTKSKRPYDPAWYRPWGPKSIGEMAGKLGRNSEYEVFYSQLSNVTHSGAFKQYVRFEGKNLVFEPIRHLKGIKTLLTIVITLAFRIYRMILAHYRFGELENFKTKYINEWQKRFFSIRDVTYKTIHDDSI